MREGVLWTKIDEGLLEAWRGVCSARVYSVEDGTWGAVAFHRYRFAQTLNEGYYDILPAEHDLIVALGWATAHLTHQFR